MTINNDERSRAFIDTFIEPQPISIKPGILVKEATQYYDLLKTYGRSKSTGAQQSIHNSIVRVLFALEKYTNATSLKGIDITKFRSSLDLIKEPHKKYNDDIAERYQTGFRKVAAILDHVHGSKDFIKYAKVHRTGSTEDTFKELINSSRDKESMEKWVELANEYIDQTQIKKTSNLRRYICNFLRFLNFHYNVCPQPFLYLSKPRHEQFLVNYKKFNNKYKKELSHLFRFSEYIIDNYMTENEEGERVVIGYPIVSDRQVFKDGGYEPSAKDQSNKLLIPSSLLFLMREIITDNDFAFPKSLNSHYFEHTDDDGKIEKVFSPVASYLFLTMLEIPIRKFQSQMLDSGEGDLVEFTRGEWVPCSSKHSGYWKKKGAAVVNRGVLRALSGCKGAGFYINTNKTQDIKVGFGEHSGYVIPWNNQVLISYLQKLRAFQEKYNPVDAPLAYRDISRSFILNDGRPSKAVLDQIPDRFYLFRNPASDDPESPISSNVLNRFFLEILQEAERILKERGEDIKIITKVNEKTGQPEKAIYTPHGLRVAGLTSMAESGVPIEVLSKIIAGHASILMTLHYVIYSDRKISEVLTSARKDIETQAKQGLRDWLKEASFESAKEYLIANNDDAITQLLANVDAAFMSSNSYGICPYAGTRCNDGGEIIKKATKTTKAKHGPVRGGKNNCVMCRHFVTGKEYAIELWLHTNKLFEGINHLAVEIDNLNDKKKSLTKKRYDFIKKQQANLIPVTLVEEIKNLEFVIEEKSELLDDTINSAHASYNIYTGIKKLFTTNKLEDNFKYETEDSLTPDINHSEPNCVETSKFASQHLLVSASRLYPQFSDSRIELERNLFVDQIYANAGMTPISLAPMTSEEKKAAIDAASDYLLDKLSEKELKNLHSGSIRLEDLKLSPEELVASSKSNRLTGDTNK